MPLRGGHVRCTLVDGGGRGAAGRGLARRRHADRPSACWPAAARCTSAGKLKADDWNGREGVELEIEDVADPRMV